MENVPLLEQFEAKNAKKVTFPLIATIAQGTFLNFLPIIYCVFKIIGQKSQKNARYYKRNLKNILSCFLFFVVFFVFFFFLGGGGGGVKLFLKMRLQYRALS